MSRLTESNDSTATMDNRMPVRREAAVPAATAGAPKKILVLGATSGIAEATCRIWAQQGSSLFLVARDGVKLAAVAQDLKTRGAAYVDTAVANLDDTDAHPALLANAINSLTGMDVAYVAYGIMGDQQAGERDFEVAAQIFHTNLISCVSLLTWLANFCVQRHAGTLAVISSVAGDRGRKSNYLYGASKAGLSAYLGGLRHRVAGEGVTVLTIKPGPIKTAMTAGMKGSEKFADVDKTAQTIVKAIDGRKDTLYVPFQWQPIMFVVRHIPEFIFKKLNF